MQAIRQAESSAGGQDQETDQCRSKKPTAPTTEELQEGLQNDLGEQYWNGRGSEEQIPPSGQRKICSGRSSSATRTAKLKCKAETDGDTAWRGNTAELARHRNPGPPDKRRLCAMGGAQSAVTDAQKQMLHVRDTVGDSLQVESVMTALDTRAPVKGHETPATEKDAGATGPQKVLRSLDLRLLRMTPEGQSRARRQDHGRECSGNGCNAIRPSSTHKQIAHGSTRARHFA